MNDETNYPPSGCRWCGIGKQSHCRGWTEEVGMHGYEHPTTDQIKARMLARRAARHHDNPRGTTVSDEKPPTALDHATTRWHETNIAIGEASGHGNPPDPFRLAALFDSRAGWWDRFGQLADQENGTAADGIRNVYAIACSFAAELDRMCAAETRFEYRIPSLHPGGDAARLGMASEPGRRCRKCGRPWQLDRAGACPICPDLLCGITPHSRADAKIYPPGTPWTPTERRWEDDND